MPKNQNNIKHK